MVPSHFHPQDAGRRLYFHAKGDAGIVFHDEVNAGYRTVQLSLGPPRVFLPAMGKEIEDAT